MSIPTTNTVFVVDDDPIARESITASLVQGGFRCRAYVSADDFLKDYDRDMAGCLVADIRMPGTSGIELIEFIAAERYDLAAVVLSAYATTFDTVRVMRHGAVSVLDKPFDRSSLREAVESALELSEQLRNRRRRFAELDSLVAKLTDVERDVVEHMLEGRSNKLTGEKLGVSERTIEQRRAKIFKKTHAGSLAEFIRLWIEWQEIEGEFR